MEKAVKELVKNLKPGINLDRLKKDISKKYKLKDILTNIEILNHLNKTERKLFKHYFITKPVRTISGVAPIAVMTKPIACKHGRCSYCPGGPDSYFGNIPQSYTGKEPATLRAIRAKYDPYLQIFNRLEQYIVLGQIPEKVELIIMGGTFPSFNKNYQEEFIKYSFKALNDFSKYFYKGEFNYERFNEFFELPCDVFSMERTKKIQNKLRKLKGKTSLEKEQLKNETSRIRCVTEAIETRPDYCMKSHINNMLKLGATRVELGIQSIYNPILHKIKRGHNIEDSIKATQLLKDSFFKVGYHIMPGLPGSNKDIDIAMFKELFENKDFKPDALKIYPCLVMPGTEVYNLWKLSKFKPLTTNEAVDIIVESKKFIPKYTRLMRVERDISSKVIIAGVDRTNLRQYINKSLKKRAIQCNCIRCKEPMGRKIDYNHVNLLRYSYEASNGQEIFLSVEDTKNDILLGFCRLRIPFKPFRPEITNNSAGIRELHVYGTSTPINKKGYYVQHLGYGKLLLNEAERIAKEEFGIRKLLIISGIGARGYFRNLSYKKDGVYMSKLLI